MRLERKKNSTINGENGASTPPGRTPPPSQSARDESRPVYFISVVAEMVETHPQTLRMYERMGLVAPCRTPAGVRLYSQADVEQVRRIQHLTQELGVNLAGVEVIFDLLREMQRLQAEMESLATRKEQGSTPRSTRSRK
jgi:MerR family transcriptional regulator/heat shock protein HspR